jgi:hypothetical protein
MTCLSGGSTEQTTSYYHKVQFLTDLFLVDVMHVQMTGKISFQFCFASRKIIQKSVSCFCAIVT